MNPTIFVAALTIEECVAILKDYEYLETHGFIGNGPLRDTAKEMDNAIIEGGTGDSIVMLMNTLADEIYRRFAIEWMKTL